MARMNQEGLNGLVGNLVFYTMNGKSYVRSKPVYAKKVRKQMAQSSPSQIFGKVSACTSALLNQMQPQLLFPLKRDAHNQCRSWLLRQYKANAGAAAWPLSCLPNDQCQLQSACDLRDVFRVQVSPEDLGGGELRVRIPAWNLRQQMSAPPNTSKLLIRIMAFTIAFSERNRLVSSGMSEISFSSLQDSQPESVIQFQLQGKKDDLLFLSLSLAYETYSAKTGTHLADAAWMPAALIGVGRRKE